MAKPDEYPGWTYVGDGGAGLKTAVLVVGKSCKMMTPGERSMWPWRILEREF